ncbi:MAG TPA: flagellar motor switch protein FliN [Candidatus Krumholzibacteria bacterium]|nr:flagellar motor switch protein FliN [Candidatus Krumholzibacteria bacterium]HRX50925.1 flagellar motor switch protein FliN [Candidatus Krumholzibacteria bacterium]
MTSDTLSPEIRNQELVDGAKSRHNAPPPPLEEDLGDASNLGVLLDIDMKVTVELGRTRMAVRDILDLAPGSVVELGKPPSEPVDLLVNGVLTARGEVVVVDDHFAIRITKLLRRGEQIKGLV